MKDSKLNMDLGESLKDEDNDERLSLIEMNPSQRIQYLERSLLFLRQQHSDVLRSLHEEVGTLKKENKGNLLRCKKTNNAQIASFLEVCNLIAYLHFFLLI